MSENFILPVVDERMNIFAVACNLTIRGVSENNPTLSYSLEYKVLQMKTGIYQLVAALM